MPSPSPIIRVLDKSTNKSTIAAFLLLLIITFWSGCATTETANTTTNMQANSTNAPANVTTTNTTTTTTNTIATANTATTGNMNNANMSNANRGNVNNGNAGGDDTDEDKIPTRDEIEEQVRHLPWGEIARDVPPEMRVGEPKSVRVYIAKRISADPSTELSDTAQVSKVKLAPVMGAFLISPDGGAFEIERVLPKDKDVQGVGGSQAAEWIWSVTPLKSGTYKLEVRATVELIVPGHQNQLVTQTVFKDAVSVRVNPIYSVKKLVKDYWYIITALVIGPIGWLINKRWGAKS